MEQRLADSVAQRRFVLTLLVLFSGCAALLASVGLYGVLAYVVSQSTHEIGIRMALGARPADVLRDVLQQGFRLAAIGLGGGLLVALAVARVLSSQLFEIGPADPTTFVAVFLLMGSVAAIACYLPARRATRV